MSQDAEIQRLEAIVSRLSRIPNLLKADPGSYTELCWAEEKLDKLRKKQKALAARSRAALVPFHAPNDPGALKQGQAVKLRAKASQDLLLRLEQNVGCELPVCVSNRRDVHNTSIQICSEGQTIWKLVRSAETLLPGPEHYPFWLWLLDRCQQAARSGHVEAPRILVNMSSLAAELGHKRSGEWYRKADEAFTRFSYMIISTGCACRLPDGTTISQSGALGTLCYYVSARTEDLHRKKSLIDGYGWIMPGPFLWQSIRDGYIKAIPLLQMRNIDSYVAQRLFLYLSKHCKPGGQYKVSLSKILPKIPIRCSSDQIKKQLHSHHRALVYSGFLACEPRYEGRGKEMMVSYKRCSAKR